jgi:glycosyltransferase involved in cell wall biosynthesis
MVGGLSNKSNSTTFFASNIEECKTEPRHPRKIILWVSPVILDTQLHREFLINTLKKLTEFGHSTSLIAMRSKHAYQSEDPQVRVVPVPLRYFPVATPLFFSIVLSIFLPLYIVKFKPDFIIMEPDVSVLSSIPSLLISKFRKQKFVLDVRSVPVEAFGFRGFLFRFWFSASVLIAKKLFQGITIITPLMRKEVCNNFEIDATKVGVWTCGASPTIFNPKNYISESAELRSQFGFSGKFVVFYHGVFTPSRGLIETIKAIKIVNQKYPEIVFFLLGNGLLISEIKELVQTEELQNKVIIHDPVPQKDVPKFIAMSNVCIVPLPNNPYWRFQCPVKLLEYLAMEKVIIATDIPAHRSISNHEKSVIYFSSVKPIHIAETIEFAYKNREKLDQWGKSGRKVILKDYTIEKIARDLETYILSLDTSVIRGADPGKE